MASTSQTGSDSFSVAAKTAIVTGAGSGINLAFAELLLSRGCNVVFADLALRPEAEHILNNYQKSPRALFVQTDVTSWPALSNMFDVTLKTFGGFDIVCPGAGVYEPHWSNFWHPPGTSESRDSPDGGHYKLLDINLNHPIRTTQLALSHWLYPRKNENSASTPPAKVSPSNPKRIVHISSIAGQMPNLRAPIYGASKFAITGFVRCLAPLDAKGVRVNAVAPGVVRTPLWLEHPEKLVNVDEEKDGWVTPEEVAAAMLRCVEEDQFIGGTILEVGKDNTRVVGLTNDPGPDKDPRKGHVNSNNAKGEDMVWNWINDPRIWSES
ncbi:Fc.00g103680.m01.CDS01 [Cosmosporella sp. VM-42]